MAKKIVKEEQDYEKENGAEGETDPVKLSKLLVKAFNKDEAKTGKVAWNLATDLDNPTEVKEFISTGNTILDYSITNRKNGGIPVGKLTEIVGEEASGKSLMCLHLAANCQKMGGVVAYLDTENAMNPEFALKIGVDLKKLIYLQPGTVEECGQAIEKMILMTRQKAPNQLVLIIWDSTAGTPTQVEIEGDYEINMNVQMEKPKAMAKMMRKLTQVWGKERIAMVFCNQLKMKPGVMYGDPTFAPGGKAVPYHASVRIQLKRRGQEKDEEGGINSVTGVNTAAKVVKNRLTWPYRKANFFISFAHGIEDEASWFELLHEEKVLEKQNGWVYCPEYKKDFKLREAQWTTTLETLPEFKEWVVAKLDDILVTKDLEKPKGADADPESLLETTQLIADLEEGS